MSLLERTPRPSPERVLNAKPLRLFDAVPEQVAPGEYRLSVPVKPSKWFALISRQPGTLRKTFALDDLGKMVWESCDGRTSIRALIRQIAKRYDLNVREVEVATMAFLKTLVQKGLVGIPVEESE
ncbi:MAG TPA: PqqD family protein [Tepidisphaeraceae bacterium]|nr:PqqD family protein [Tepidisphaeraceae bacterium]